MKITSRERLSLVFNFKKPCDRLPRLETVGFWDKTVGRWISEGLNFSGNINDNIALAEHFGLDPYAVIVAQPYGGVKRPERRSDGIFSANDNYSSAINALFSDKAVDYAVTQAMWYKERHESGDLIVRLWLDGFFWFDREMFGVENHFYAFYDNAELMREINYLLAEFNKKVVKAVCGILKPDYVSVSEDFTYKGGPMCSYKLYKEFQHDYYVKYLPVLKSLNIPVFMDTDGYVHDVAAWLAETGFDGLYPLERKAGSDANFLREKFPNLLLMGNYDKHLIADGEEAIKSEFERLLPVMSQSGFLPSVDHKTPPEVSFENYLKYIELFKKYTEMAVK